LKFNGAIELGETHSPKHLSVFLGPSDHAFYQRDFQHSTHGSFSLSQILDLEPTSGGDRLDTFQLFQTINRGLDDIVRIVGPHALGQNVLNAHSLKHRTNGTTGDNAGTF
jgi:hypothetical protein